MTNSKKIAEQDIAKLAATVTAPESLHRRVREMVEHGTSRRARRRGALAGPRLALGAAAAVLAVAALAFVLALSGGGAHGLTVQRTVALTLSRATMPPPAESTTKRSELAVSVEGVTFPYWRERFGWRSAGARIDRVGGRRVTTVFYADATGHTVGYAIVSGRALPTSGGTLKWRRDVPYRVLRQGGATVVAWPRGGHLCVISGRGVSAATLLALAGWSGSASVA